MKKAELDNDKFNVMSDIVITTFKEKISPEIIKVLVLRRKILIENEEIVVTIYKIIKNLFSILII